MDASSPTMRTTQIRYPDKRKGPFLIRGEWRWLQGQWMLVGYAQGFAEEADLRELQTEDARALRLPLIKARSALELARQLRAEGQELAGVPTPPPSSREQYRRKLLRQREEAEAAQAAQRRGRGRPPVPLAELQQVGRIYAQAYRANRFPTKAVAEQLDISYAAATNAWPAAGVLASWGRPNRARRASVSSWDRATRPPCAACSPSRRSWPRAPPSSRATQVLFKPMRRLGRGKGHEDPPPLCRHRADQPAKWRRKSALRGPKGPLLVQGIGPLRAAPGQEVLHNGNFAASAGPRKSATYCNIAARRGPGHD